MSIDIQVQAMQAQSLIEKSLLSRRNVVGVGVGYKESNGVLTDEIAVVVLVGRKKPAAALTQDELIPRDVDGMRTDVIEVGELWANQLTPRDRYRPVIPSGVSIGHYKVTAGTLGTMVRDRRTGRLMVLSNNHVLANCNDAAPGDVVLQPAAMDGGIDPADVVAKLERYVKLGYVGDPVMEPVVVGLPQPTPAGCNPLGAIAALLNALAGAMGSTQRIAVTQAAAQQVRGPALLGLSAQDAQSATQNRCDCALAAPVDPAMFSDDIVQIGMVRATRPPQLNMRVRKFGRTTGYTEGVIKLLNATVNVGYATAAGPRQAQFVGQVIAEPMSQGGDSGSLIVDVTDSSAVGLLFAGSPLATIFTPIDVVLNTLEVDI